MDELIRKSEVQQYMEDRLRACEDSGLLDHSLALSVEAATLKEVQSAVEGLPVVDAISRETLVKRLFPLGVPLEHDPFAWKYSINAKEVYEAIMREEEGLWEG